MKWTVAENLEDIKSASKEKLSYEILCLTYEVYIFGKNAGLNVTFIRDEIKIDNITSEVVKHLRSVLFTENISITLEAHRPYLSKMLMHLMIANEVAKRLCLIRSSREYNMLLDIHCIDAYYRAFKITKYNKVHTSNALKMALLIRSGVLNKLLYYFIFLTTILIGVVKFSVIILYELLSWTLNKKKKAKYSSIIIGWGRDFVRFFNSDSEVVKNTNPNSELTLNILTRPKKVQNKTFCGDIVIAKETMLFGESYGVSLSNFNLFTRVKVLWKCISGSIRLINVLKRRNIDIGVDLFLYSLFYHKGVITELEFFQLIRSKSTRNLITSDSDLPSVRFLLLYGISQNMKVFSTVHGSSLYDYFGNWYLSNNRITTDICFPNGYREGDIYLRRNNSQKQNYINGSNCILIATRSNGYQWSSPTFDQRKFYQACSQIANLLPDARFIIKSHPSGDAYYLYDYLAEKNVNITHDKTKFDMNFSSITSVLSIGDTPSLLIDAISYGVPVFYSNIAQNAHQKIYSYGFEDNFSIDSIDVLINLLNLMVISKDERRKYAYKQYQYCKKSTLP